MKKGKHSTKDVYRKKRIRWDRIIGLLLLIFLIIFGIKQIKNFNINVEAKEQKEPYEIVEKSNANLEEEVTEKEDESVKLLVEQIKQKNKLNENNFAFFYYNINEKTYYFYNQDTYFSGASTIKVPIVMAYYDEINQGRMSIEDTLTYKEGCYEPGGGKTDYTYKVGGQVPLQFLIKEAIINSDNTANNILIENLGYKECKYLLDKYSEVDLPEEFYSSNITSGKYGYDVVNYLYEHEEEYSELIGYLKQSSDGQYLKKYIKQYDVAHKYGSYNGNVHDYGIVYSDKPYLIGVFTKGIVNADELIAKISKQVLEKHMEK